jgi:cytochrome c peroxidase
MVVGAAAFAGDWTWSLPPGFPVPVVPADNPMSAAKVDLGRRLFFEPRLSVTGRHSCASCHDPALAFTDGRAVAEGALGDRLPRAAMPLANVAYSPALGWADPAITTLEQQMLTPMFGEHPVELGLAAVEPALLAALRAEPAWRDRFAAAFPADADPVSRINLVRAIATFERTLVSGRSAFDRYVFDDERGSMDGPARRGMALFYGRARCGDCHAGINFSGPVRSVATPEATGLFADNGHSRGELRVPTLRNVALTAPYMHDGALATLVDVVDHYDRRGSLKLGKKDREALVAFLESLTDRDFVAAARGLAVGTGTAPTAH